MNISWADYRRPQGQEWYAWLLNELMPFELLPCLCHASPPTPRNGKTRTNGVPKLRDIERFAQFIEEVLERYQDRFDYIELWNEPDTRRNGSRCRNSDLEVSVQMLIDGASAVVMYGKKIVLGGIGPAGGTPYDHPWIQQNSDITENVDVIAVRAFPSQWNDPSDTWCGWPTTLVGLRPYARDHKIWITETGCVASTQGDEDAQVLRLNEAVFETDDAERIYWYTVLDLPNMYGELESFLGVSREPSERSYGLVGTDGRRKPVFDEMKTLLHS
jgi:hypothetical protein